MPRTTHTKNEVFTTQDALIRLADQGCPCSVDQFRRAANDVEGFRLISPMRLPNGTRLFKPAHLPHIRARIEARCKTAGALKPADAT